MSVCQCDFLLLFKFNQNWKELKSLVNIKNMKYCENTFGLIRAVPPEEKDGTINITYARSSYSKPLWVSAIRRV